MHSTDDLRGAVMAFIQAQNRKDFDDSNAALGKICRLLEGFVGERLGDEALEASVDGFACAKNGCR